MIGALLSNTPASLLRNSGVAGDLAPGTDVSVQNREPSTARDSQASPRFEAVNAQKTPLLTSQAILALQDSEASSAPSGRRRLAEQPGGPQSEANGANEEPQQGAGGQQANAAAANTTNPAEANGAAVQQASEDGDPDGDGLNEAEEKLVEKLKQRDREVKAHEQAHARVGGAYAGAPSYTFQQGPDGKRYAVGGEVQIDTAPERTPEATIRKMRVVISAALAPAEPSGQDLRVAQQARSQLSEAQAQLRQQKLEELQGGDEDSGGVEGASQSSGNEPSSSPNSGNGPSTEASGASDGADNNETDDGGRNEASRLAIGAYQAAVERGADQQAQGQSLVI